MNKTLSVMSLRVLMTLLVGLLVVVALAFSVRDLQQSLSTSDNVTLLAERNRIADNCLQAVKNFAFERGRSNVVLRGQDQINQEYRRFIDGYRADADRHIGELLAQLPEVSRKKGEEVRSAWERVKVLRPMLEQDFSRRLDERDPALPGLWLKAANDLVAGLEALLIDVSSFSGNIDANFERLNNLRNLALQFRNLVGTESTTFAAELSSARVPSRETIGTANLLRGRSMQLWSQLEPGVESLADPESSAALERVRSRLFGLLRPMQDDIIRAAGKNELASIDKGWYLEVSISALNSTVDLADGISRMAAVYTQNRLEHAKRQKTLSLASIATILILGGLVVVVLIWRFTRPLNEVLGRIDKLLGLQEGVSSLAPPTVGGDEFGRVRQALEQLDAAMKAHLQSEKALDESERISASILACIPQSIIATDIDGLITVFSPGAENMLGYSANEMVGKMTPLLFHDHEEIRTRSEELTQELGFDVDADFNVFVAGVKISAKPEEREWTYIRKDGIRITVLLAATSLRNAQGVIDGYLGVATDITERKIFETELLYSAREQDKQNSLLTALLKTIPVGVLMVEAPSGKPLIANDAAFVLLGREGIPWESKNDLSDIYAAFMLPERVPYPVEESPIVLGMQGQRSHVEDMTVVLPDGSERILDVMGSPVRDGEGRVWASVVSFIDITNRSQATAEMMRLAYHDHLTRLPNRRLFHDRIQMAITQARRESSRLALMLIDLDKFKPVNDNLGHSVGDLLLKAVAKRMQACLRESDTLARIGGDEFVVILPDIVEVEDALGVAEKIRLALNEHFDLAGGYRVSIACSIGIAIYPDHGRDEKRLSMNADDAMYTAKELGRNCVCLFSGVAAGRTRRDAGDRNASFVRLVWHKSYRCGEESIDREHHELFDRANKLIQVFMAGEEGSEKLPVVLDEMVDCVASHFANEEIVLARYQYDGLEDHMLKHQRLLGRALDLRRQALAGELTLGDLVTFLAQEVVVKHMHIEDHKYFPLFKKALNRERIASVMATDE
jgi:diguanylate cyclase (GGDEF)-like protein/hemerythrin-like metal-binding protein